MKKLIFIFVIGSLLLSGCSRKETIRQDIMSAPTIQNSSNPKLPDMVPWWRKCYKIY